MTFKVFTVNEFLKSSFSAYEMSELFLVYMLGKYYFYIVPFFASMLINSVLFA